MLLWLCLTSNGPRTGWPSTLETLTLDTRHLKHEVPEPYVWDSTFSVDYHRLDEEHNVLFANILAVSQNPSDDSALQTLKDNMRLHFDYEQQRYCAVPNYNCVDHK